MGSAEQSSSCTLALGPCKPNIVSLTELRLAAFDYCKLGETLNVLIVPESLQRGRHWSPQQPPAASGSIGACQVARNAPVSICSSAINGHCTQQLPNHCSDAPVVARLSPWSIFPVVGAQLVRDSLPSISSSDC